MSVLKKTTIALVATALIAGSFGTALADKRGGGRDGAKMMPGFEKVDANADGSVTFDEFAKPIMERFDTADADKNGAVNAEEITAAIDGGRRAERMAERLITRFDINKDGSVSKDEIENRQKKMFALLDLDDSGSISKEEMPDREGRDRGGRDRDNHKKRGDRN